MMLSATNMSIFMQGKFYWFSGIDKFVRTRAYLATLEAQAPAQLSTLVSVNYNTWHMSAARSQPETD